MFGRKKTTRAKSPKRGGGGGGAGAALAAAAATTFDKYKDPELEEITDEGIIAMCDDLEIDVESDVVILAFLWKCGCKKAMTITRDEFLAGMAALKAGDVSQLKGALHALREEVYGTPDAFRSFFTAAFKLSLETSQKTLPSDVAAALLQLIVRDPSGFPHLEPFIEYISTTEAVKRITFDEWCQFLTFSRSIKEDLSDWDPDDITAAWPLLIDEYVEWRIEKKSGK